jgi:ribosomal protein S6--L-glutamate ligase
MKKYLILFIIVVLINPVPELFPKKKKKITIGRIEVIKLPKFGIKVEARIDTGAKTCSLHYFNKEIVSIGKGKYIEFDTEDSTGKVYHMRSKIIRTSIIKSSSGDKSTRYIIKETIQLGSITKEVLISLNDREKMKYNVLIGRNFLIGRFVVDVALSHATGDLDD